MYQVFSCKDLQLPPLVASFCIPLLSWKLKLVTSLPKSLLIFSRCWSYRKIYQGLGITTSLLEPTGNEKISGTFCSMHILTLCAPSNTVQREGISNSISELWRIPICDMRCCSNFKCETISGEQTPNLLGAPHPHFNNKIRIQSASYGKSKKKLTLEFRQMVFPYSDGPRPDVPNHADSIFIKRQISVWGCVHSLDVYGKMYPIIS